MSKPTIAAIRRAVADYMSSEGCACCRGYLHDMHAAILAELLKVPEYEDGSGHDFGRFASKRKVARRGPAS